MKKLTFDINFEIGQVVFIKTDNEQLPRIVIGYSVRPGNVLYEIQSGLTISTHYSFELTDQINILDNMDN